MTIRLVILVPLSIGLALIFQPYLFRARFDRYLCTLCVALPAFAFEAYYKDISVKDQTIRAKSGRHIKFTDIVKVQQTNVLGLNYLKLIDGKGECSYSMARKLSTQISRLLSPVLRA